MRSDIDNAIAALAAGQLGVWTFRQGARLGVTRSMASRRVLKGIWVRLYPDVYVHRSWVRTPEGEALAAAWSLAEGLASHEMAAVLHAVDGRSRRAVEVTVPRGRYQPRGFRVHETRWLPPADRTVVRMVPCTSLERTLIDLSSRWKPARLEDAWDAAINDGRTTASRLQTTALPLIGRGRAESDLLRALLEKRDDTEPPPESVLERVLIDLVDSMGYGPMTRQMPIPLSTGLVGRVDGYLPHVGLILEADGRRWHTRVRDFERDHLRDNELQAVGFHVARFTYGQLVHERADVIRIMDKHFRRRGFVRTPSGLWVRAAA